MFKYALITSFFISQSVFAASVPSYFQKFEGKYKAPFGLNMLQFKNTRTSVKSGAVGSGPILFQVAFRSDVAKQLVEEHGMYTGNLFASNYYELKAEFLKGNPHVQALGTEDNLSKLVQVSKQNPAVYKRAQQMVKNWNLEKLYILKNPSSRISRSFKERGIAGAEFEQKYGQLFTNYYIEESNTNLDLLALVKLVDSSSLVASSSFTKIRDKATSLYETYKPEGSKGHYVGKGVLAQIKDIRDSIHNQLTPEVINTIDIFMSKTKSSQGHSELRVIRGLIKSYFARGVTDINHIAKKGKIKVSGLKAINTKRPKIKDLMNYANELVLNRKNMLSSNVSLNSKYIHLAYTSTAASFLFDKTRAYISRNRINGKNIKELTGVLYRLLYLQGLLNEQSFSVAQNAPADFDDYEILVDDLLTEVIGNIKTAYAPYTDKWKQVDKRMGGIVDDSIRSSAVNLFNHILDKMD